MGEPKLVTSLVTRGRDGSNQWVTSYTLDSSLDGEVWTAIRNPFNPESKVFAGNFDRDSERRHDILVVARFVRLNILTFHLHPSMRWGVFACDGLCFSFSDLRKNLHPHISPTYIVCNVFLQFCICSSLLVTCILYATR